MCPYVATYCHIYSRFSIGTVNVYVEYSSHVGGAKIMYGLHMSHIQVMHMPYI